MPDWPRVADWLRWTLADLSLHGLRIDAPMEVRAPHGLFDPDTIVVRFGGADLELHASPQPHAGAVTGIEHLGAWLTALYPHYPLAPRVLAVCTDASVLGRPFIVTDHRRGVAFTHEEPLALHGQADARARLSLAVVDALADLHAVDAEAEPFAGFGHDPGALDRDLQHWLGRWTSVRGAVPDLDAVALWLTAYEPPESLDLAVVHGRFGLAALRVDPLDPHRVTAVLDWEHVRRGDPLADLGTLLASWVAVDDHTPTSTGLATAAEGYATRSALAVRYGARTGRPLDTLPFHEAFGLFRRAVALASTSPRPSLAAIQLAEAARQRTLGEGT